MYTNRSRSRKRRSVMVVPVAIAALMAIGVTTSNVAAAATKTTKKAATTKKATATTKKSTTAAPAGSSAPVTTPTPASAAPANKDPYKISMMVDLTGSLGTNGIGAAAGFTAYFKSVNDAGGINGHPIDMNASVDSLSTTDGAQAAAAKVVGEKPTAIVAYGSTSGLAAITPILSAAKVPFVSAQVIDSMILPTPLPWFFTTSAAQAQLVTMYVNETKNLLGGLTGKRIGLEAVNTAGADNTVNGLRTAFAAAGAQVVSIERTNLTGVSSFASQAANMAAAKPDLIIAQDTNAVTALVVKALATAGYNSPILITQGAADDGTLSAIGANWVYGPRSYYGPLTDDIMSKTAKRYGLEDKVIGGIFPVAWAAAVATVEALKKCGYPCPPDKFITSMESLTTYDAGPRVAFGPLGFSKEKHYAPKVAQFYTWSSTAGRSAPDGPPVAMD